MSAVLSSIQSPPGAPAAQTDENRCDRTESQSGTVLLVVRGHGRGGPATPRLSSRLNNKTGVALSFFKAQVTVAYRNQF